MKRKEKILVVIPYLAKEAQGQELLYAVAGWRKHFKEDYLIVVVGDWHPVVDTGEDIVFIDCPRVPSVLGEYQAHLDHVNKFRKVMETFDVPGFIYTCDDIYAINDFTMEDVLVPKIQQEVIGAKVSDMNKWSRNNAKTKKVLEREGLPVANYVCHLPVYYECDKLLQIYDKYDCDHNSYVVEQLYFNTFNIQEPIRVFESECKYKYRQNRAHQSKDDLEQAFVDKIWINNSIKGWTAHLDSLLKRHYGL